MVFVFKNEAYIAHRNITTVQIDESSYAVKISGLLNLLGEKEGNAKRSLIIPMGTMQRAIELAEPLLSSLHSGYEFFMYVENEGNGKCFSLYKDLSEQIYSDYSSPST